MQQSKKISVCHVFDDFGFSKFAKINTLRHHIDLSVKFSNQEKPVKKNVEYQTLQKVEIFGHFMNCTNQHFMNCPNQHLLKMFNCSTFF